jgi:hypothetical protein
MNSKFFTFFVKFLVKELQPWVTLLRDHGWIPQPKGFILSGRKGEATINVPLSPLCRSQCRLAATVMMIPHMTSALALTYATEHACE